MISPTQPSGRQTIRMSANANAHAAAANPRCGLISQMEAGSPAIGRHVSALSPSRQMPRNGRRDRRRSSEDSTEVDALIGMGSRYGHRKVKSGSQNARKYGSDGSGGGGATAVTGESVVAAGADVQGRAQRDAMLFLLEEQKQYSPSPGYLEKKFHVSDKIWVSAIANLSTAVCSLLLHSCSLDSINVDANRCCTFLLPCLRSTIWR